MLRQQIFQVGFSLGQGQPVEQIAEVKIGFQPIGFGSFDETVHGGTGFGSGGVAIEKPISAVMQNST